MALGSWGQRRAGPAPGGGESVPPGGSAGSGDGRATSGGTAPLLLGTAVRLP